MDGDASFGAWLRRRRKALDLTQDALARLVGCSVGMVRMIEADERRPSRQLAERLARYLELPTADQAAFLRAARAELAVDRLPPPARSASGSARDQRAPHARALRGYTLYEQLGTGGFGAVYRAAQPGVGRDVAVKIILPEFANHPEFIRRFEAEAQIVARLEHPHIVPLYDYWRESGGAYLVMRYIRGGSLQAALHGAAWSFAHSVQLLDQVGAALAFAHRHGVVHRDLKPANILLDEDENAYLADFGIAKDLGTPTADDPTQAHALVGSPAYLAPEQIMAAPVTPRTDIYSLGVLLYELLAGAHPFQSPTASEIIAKHLRELVPLIHPHHPHLPAAIDAVIQRATAKSPDDRYADVPSLLADVRRALAAARGAAPAPLDPAHASADAETALLSTLLDETAPDLENPYKGLRAFDEADADDFFGRADLTQQLLALLAADTTNARFLAVVGPSGSGKSSVVRAGLIPALRRGALAGSAHWFVVELFPGAHPFEELEAALLRVAVNPPPTLLEQLQSDARGLARAVKRVLPEDDTIELALVIDQFEELFTLTEDDAVRTLFLQSLAAAVLDPRSRVRLIVTLRADFTDRPLLYPGVGELLQDRTAFVLPLAPDAIAQAITAPASRVGLLVEPELITAIVADVGAQPGMLPLLQYALTELFEQRRGRVLTRTAYRASGGVLGALSRRADELYERLNQDGREAARQLFLRLVTLGEGVEDTRRRVRRDELASDRATDTDAIIDGYGRYRLLTFDRDPVTRGPTVEVAHEALIRTWGQLRAWLDESRDALRVQRRLLAAASEWALARQNESFLAAGARLAQFEALAQASDLALNAVERAYVHASVAARERQELAERDRQARELALQRRAANRLRALVAVLALFLVVALGLSVVALNRQATAQANFTRAEAQRLGAEANALLQVGGNAEVIALLGVRSMQTQYTPQGDAALAGAAKLAYPRQIFTGHTDGITSVAYSPDGRYVLTSSVDKTARLWDVQTGQQLRAFIGHTDAVGYVAYSPDGKYVLTSSNDKTARLWDAQTGQQLRIFSGHTDLLSGVAFSPDGRYVLTSSNDKTVRLWDAQTGQQLRIFTGHTDWVFSVAYSPDGKQILTASIDKTARLWDVATGRELRRFAHPDFVYTVAFSPNLRYALTGGQDKIARLWDIQTGQEVRQYTGATTGVYIAVFSPDGKYIAAGTYDNIVRLWDVATGQELRRFIGHTGEVDGLAFSPDGRYLLTGSVDGTARLWDVPASADLPQFVGHTDAVTSAVFSPDGQAVLTASQDQTARLWDARTGALLRTLSGHVSGVVQATFSADGRMLVTTGRDRTMRLWDAGTGALLRTLSGGKSAFWTIALSRDGRYLLAGSDDHSAWLWDIQTGKVIRTFVGHTLDIYGVAFAPDARSVLTGSLDGTARLWDLQTGVLIRTFTKQTGGIDGVAFSPDGKYVLTGNYDKTARLWDAQTGAELRVFAGHTNVVTSVAFSADGNYILTGSQDKTARLWDAQTGQELRRFTGHADTVSSVAFAPDGRQVLTSSLDGTARLWELDYQATIRYLCGRLRRDLSDDERAQYSITDSTPSCPKP